METYAQFTKSISLEKYGIKNTQEIIYNPSFEFLYKEELSSNLEGYEESSSFDCRLRCLEPDDGKWRES